MRKPKKRSNEGRLWLLVCVFAGLFILGLFYLKLQKSKIVQQPPVTVSPQAGKKAVKSPPTPPPAAPEPKFDFYTMLPNGNSAAPPAKTASPAESSNPEQAQAAAEEHASSASDSTAQTTSENEKPSKTTKNTEANTPAPSTSDEVAELEKQQLAEESGGAAVSTPAKSYIVQLAVFHNPDAANQFKAQLAMMGIEVKVKTIVKNGNTSYRASMGPFQSKTEATAAQQQLKTNHISPGVIR